MKILFAFLFLLSALTIVSTPAHADTITYGPITLSSNAPFGEGGFYSYPDNSVFVAFLPGVYDSSQNGSNFTSGSISFTYDLTPGWTADAIITDNIDYGATQAHWDAGDWAVAFFQEVILCPSDSPSNCTSGAIRQDHYGPSPLPSEALTPNAVAGPGTGIYQYAEYAHNAQFATDGGIAGIRIYLTPVPEPSTFVLIGSGALGLLGLVKRKLSPSNS